MISNETVDAVVRMLESKAIFLTETFNPDTSSQFEKGIYTGKLQTISITIAQLKAGDLNFFARKD